MEKILRQSLLYDFYGELLNEHQKSIYEDYVLNDIGISEIAAIKGVSRQSVHEIIKRCDNILETYEAKLKLMSKFLETKQLVKEIHSITKKFSSIETSKEEMVLINRINEISNRIIEEL